MPSWLIYNRAKGHLGSGTIDLDSDTINAVLATSGSNASDLALSARDQLTAIVTASDQPITTSWVQGLSAAEMKLTSEMMTWMGPLAGLKHVIVHNGSKLICQYTLDNPQDVAAGTSFNVVVSNSIFRLS